MRLILLLLALLSLSFPSYYLEKGEIEKLVKKYGEGMEELELKALKAFFENLELEVEPYIELYARGLVLEKKGELKKALEYYLRSIALNPHYNPSYYRFNFLIRKVENPEDYRKRIVNILKKRFRETPPVILENPEDHYVFLVEKMSQYLFVFRGKKLLEMHPVTTGKNIGDKEREGDARTPEGIYYFTRIIPPKDLPKMYGGIAVVLNYPNPYDRLVGKTGSGIWLHGSDEEDRNNLPFSTRGCIVAENAALREAILPKINLSNTLIGVYKVIPQSLETDDVKAFLEKWKEAWERKDLKGFLSFYSERFRWKGGGKKEWERYKRRTILSKKFIEVKISNLTVVAFAKRGEKRPLYYLAEFFQEYKSDTYSDKGVKRLYILREGGSLRIISEEFTEVGDR